MGPSGTLCCWLALGLASMFAQPPGADARHKHFHYRVPLIDLNGADQLVGTVREDARIVTVSPQLRILHGTGPVCRYELSWAEEEEDAPDGTALSVPFEARVLDSADGTAEIRHLDTATPLDCAHKADYRIRVVAVKCGDEGAKSEPVELKISVQDVNNHAPEFDAPWYAFDVDEGDAETHPREIARLFARDADCGHPYGKVCRYELTNTLASNPFRIDDRGVLSVQRALNRSEAASHILTVVAEDCGMRRSNSVLVTVNVRPRCVDSLRSPAALTPRHLAQGDAAGLPVFPDAEVNACGSDACVAEADMELEEAGDEHLLTPDELRECGMDRAQAVELLPEGNGRARKMKTNDADADEDADDEQWTFDGKTMVVVPEERVNKPVPERFTLLFSMRAEEGTEEQQRQKQNILCETDAKGLNRHHFAVYLRRCKLELLLRREPEHASAEFRAAEWRWTDARICDGDWHRYGLLFNDLDNVQLLIDGELFNGTDRNPEILDDWPLHEVNNHNRTKMVVGACWHGRQREHVQYFNGHLSALWLWPGRAQDPRAVQCVHAPHARLALGPETKLVHGQSIRFTAADRTQAHLHAGSPADLARLIRAVHFMLDPVVSSAGTQQRRLSPAVHERTRRVTLSAQLVCTNAERNVSRPLAPIQATIDVTHAHDRPKLSVTGRSLVYADRSALKSGAALLPDVQIAITQGAADVTGGYKLDWCRLHMRPARDMDLELFSSPTALLQSLNLQFVHDKQGFALKGAESAKAYAQVLSHVHYFNLRPQAFPHRSYTLQCVMLEGKVLSNELFTSMQIDASTGDPKLDDAVQKLVQISDKLDADQPFGTLPSSASSSSEEEEAEDNGKSKQGQDHQQQLELHNNEFDGELGASNRLQNILEMDLPRPKALMGTAPRHGYEMGQGAIAGGAVAVVVVICVGFLLVLLVIGVLKMRDQPLPIGRRRGSRRDSMLEWDDNGMNITVNPLEEVGKGEGAEPGGVLDYSEVEDDEEDEEEEEEDSGSEDGGDREPAEDSDDGGDDPDGHVLPLVEKSGRQGAGLEWDDSTLDGPPPAGRSSSSSHRRYHHV